jgi:NitT/TauT family transport system substrate-binding protein
LRRTHRLWSITGVAEQTNTKFGALDSRLAAALRHALDVAVTFAVLAPMNEVHLRLTAMSRIVDVNDSFSDPPSHKWHEFMVELFGRNRVGARREPVSLIANRPRSTTLAHLEFARTYLRNAAERQVVHHILAAAGAFVIAESITLSDEVRRRNICGGRDTFVGDDLIAEVHRAGVAGKTLIAHATGDTWWHLLSAPGTGVGSIPRQRVPAPAPVGRAQRGVRRGGGSALPPAPGLGTAHPPARRATGRLLAVAGSLAVVVLLGLWVVASGPTISEAGRLTASGLEKPDAKFSIMTTTDLAPFWLAVKKGYFRDEGFTFDPMNDVLLAKSGAESVAMLTNKQVDIAYATYSPFLIAQSRGIANLRLVAAASSAGPGSCMVVALPGSKIKGAHDLAGARVAITARGTISELMVESALKDSGVDHTTIHWVEVPFADMMGKLNSGEVDAAFVTEPFVSQAQKATGAVPVLDTAVHHTAELPTAGFGVDAAFVRRYPKTVAAFQRVMARATSEARASRANVEPVLMQFAQVDQAAARLPSLLTFESSLDPAKIQRVADLMLEFGMVHESVDVTGMIARLPAGLAGPRGPELRSPR